jgi:tRNA uridine 5-carboxymethylaminomethyl modification enzyme
MAFEAKISKIDSARKQLLSLAVTPNEAEQSGVRLNRDGVRRTAWDLLSYTDIDWEQVARLWPGLGAIDGSIASQLKSEASYSVYLERQQRDISALQRDESVPIPENFDYRQLSGLSHEIVQKLERVRPGNLGQAGRIDGMTPAALTLILTGLKRRASMMDEESHASDAA